jgi:Zn-dependent protease with chaperone function
MNKLAVEYFDGRSSRATPAWVHAEPSNMGQDVVVTAQDDGRTLKRAAAHTLRWPERTQAGSRMARFATDESVHTKDAAAWDAFASAARPHTESWVITAQQQWRWVGAALVLTVGILWAAYQWGIPAASRGALVLIPQSVDKSIGDIAEKQVDGMLTPTALSKEEQDAWRKKFADVVAKSHGPAHPGNNPAPTYKLEFRKFKEGPNAFALPGGTMVMTDELIALAAKEPALQDHIVLGVLAHELGHVKYRHGMQHLVSSSILGLVATVVWGDFSSVIAAVPLWLGQASYSRDAERQADEESRRIMAAAGLNPMGMVKFFELMRADQAAKKEAKEIATGKTGKKEDQDALNESSIPIGISTHPSDEERMAAFRKAAGASAAK